MSDVTQFANTPASQDEPGLLQRKWRSFCFFLRKRAFESKLESILRAAAGHESNSLPVGDSHYQLLNAEANSICTDFAGRWGLDLNLLKARIAGLAKLERLSLPPQTMNYTGLAYLSVVAIPLLCFLMGAVAGLVNVGFHLVGGR